MVVVSRTIHPFPRCPKPARESRLLKLAYHCQYIFRRRRRTRNNNLDDSCQSSRNTCFVSLFLSHREIGAIEEQQTHLKTFALFSFRELCQLWRFWKKIWLFLSAHIWSRCNFLSLIDCVRLRKRRAHPNLANHGPCIEFYCAV